MGKTQCSECAFRPGGAAFKEPYNNLRANICARGPIPFFCHHGIDWEKQHAPEFIANYRSIFRQSGICQGWKAEVARLNRSGFYGDGFRAIRQIIARDALAFLDRAIDAREDRLWKHVHRLIRFLFCRNIANKTIPMFDGEPFTWSRSDLRDGSKID